MQRDFNEYCLLNMSNQFLVGIVFSCFLSKTTKTVLHYKMTNRQYFCVEESLKNKKLVSMHSSGVSMTVGYRNKIVKADR